MGAALGDVEPREERRRVERAGDLARAAADAVHELALRDDRRDLVAARLVARPDDLVEVERLAGQEHVAVELRRREAQVEAARLVLQVARVLGLEPAEHRVGRHARQAAAAVRCAAAPARRPPATARPRRCASASSSLASVAHASMRRPGWSGESSLRPEVVAGVDGGTSSSSFICSSAPSAAGVVERVRHGQRERRPARWRARAPRRRALRGVQQLAPPAPARCSPSTRAPSCSRVRSTRVPATTTVSGCSSHAARRLARRREARRRRPRAGSGLPVRASPVARRRRLDVRGARQPAPAPRRRRREPEHAHGSTARPQRTASRGAFLDIDLACTAQAVSCYLAPPSPWASPSASSACPTSASRRSSTRSRPRRPRRPTIPSAPSSRTSASSWCPTRASQALDGVVHADRIVPATIDFVDIAGLVRGRAKGEGLGNQFLAHIREVDAVVQVARCFEDANVVHVENRVDPVADIATVTTELCLKDLDTVQKRARQGRARWPRRTTRSRSSRSRCASALGQAPRRRASPRAPSSSPTTPTRPASSREMHLLTAKPTFYIANVDEASLAQPRGQPALPGAPEARGGRGRARRPHLRRARGADRRARPRRPPRVPRERRPQGAGPARGHPHRLRAAGPHHVLHRRQDGGARLDDRRRGAKAPQAAGVIHTDFEKGFIKAEVIWWEDFVKLGGEAKCREAGKLGHRGQGVRRARRGRDALPVQRVRGLPRLESRGR